MMAADIFRPEQWTNYFLMVGGAAAALTGLVFVAMSLNLEAIAKDMLHRYRAVGTLAGFIAVFIICALGLMGGQDHRAVGLEWLVAAAGGAAVYLNGIVRTRIRGRSLLGIGIYRIGLGTGLYVVEIIGAVLFALGHIGGLYVAAVSMVVLLAYTVTGAWLLVMAVHAQYPKP